jgi:hypothetical protein
VRQTYYWWKDSADTIIAFRGETMEVKAIEDFMRDIVNIITKVYDGPLPSGFFPD